MNWKSAKTLRSGERVFFEYQCTPSEQSAHAELWHHTCQFANVVRRIGPDEIDEAEVGPMFHVRFADGFHFDVNAGELWRRRQKDCKPWRGCSRG